MKNDKNNIKSIADIIKQQTNEIDQLDKNVFGVSKLEDIDNVVSTVSKLVNQYNGTDSSSLLNVLINKSKESNDRSSREFEKIKDAILHNKNSTMFESLLSEKYTKIAKYEDLMVITKLVPKLKDVKKFAVTSILSPDDFTKQISLNMSYAGTPLEVCDPELYNEINSVLKKYKFTKHMKHSIDRAITLGEYYLAIIPYSRLFSELMEKKSKKYINESSSNLFDINNTILSEEAVISNTFENPDKIKRSIIECVNNCEIITENGALELFDIDLIEATIKSKTDKTDAFQNNFDKIAKSFMNNKASNIISNDGIMDTNKINEFETILGCKIKRLDPRRLIKLQIDEDTILGYYYIETQEAMNIIRDSNTYRLRDSVGQMDSQNGVASIYKSLGDLLLNKLDKKFIDNNIGIKEQIYDVLHYADATNNRLKIIYLDNSEVEEFSIDGGESMFEQALFFAKIYVATLLTNIAAKMARGNDVRAYWVHTDPQGGVSTLVNNAINTLQKNNRAFYSMTNLSKMVSSFNVFDDLFIPVDKDEKKPIDFDIISGQSIDLNTEFLEMIENICIESTGTPKQLIETSADVDFAKSFSVLNLKYMRMILDYQVDLNTGVDGTAKKILNTEIVDEEKKNKINSIEFTLQSPMALLLSNLMDQINNAKDLSGAIAELVYGQNNQDDASYDNFILEICKKYAPNVPWSSFEEIKKNSIIKNKENDEPTEEEV